MKEATVNTKDVGEIKDLVVIVGEVATAMKAEMI